MKQTSIDSKCPKCGTTAPVVIAYHLPINEGDVFHFECKECGDKFSSKVILTETMEPESEFTKEEKERLTPEEKERIRKKKFIHAVKAIVAHEFSSERNKQRLTDKEKNTALVRLLGDALTVIECNIKESLGHLEKGEELSTIIPE